MYRRKEASQPTGGLVPTRDMRSPGPDYKRAAKAAQIEKQTFRALQSSSN